MILEVAFPVPVPKTFDYRLPAGLDVSGSLIGCRVAVQFGFRPSTGVVVAEKETSSSPADKLKSILRVVDHEPVLSRQQIALAQWLAHRYVCSMGEALDCLLPPGGKGKDAPVDVHHGFETASLPGSNRADFEHTPSQKLAMSILHDAIYSDGGKAFLLRGVAAAGKTEVYLSAINDVLGQQKSALYLVPEIGLCLQAFEILKHRFGENNVVAYHSDLTLKQRFELWWKIRRGECPIVVGARSACLLPQPDLGVVIVDEEQDSAYKEDRKPRFHVRDVAIERARLSNALVLFGTATPTLELYEEALAGRVQLIEIDERAVQASAPQIRMVDVRAEKKFGSMGPSMLKAIGERLHRNERAVIFLNRRGFHRFMQCGNCDWRAACEKCGVSFVVHGTGFRKELRCHYCSMLQPLPTVCPKCGNKKLFSAGVGTQKVEEEIKEKFPWARVGRWDSDNVKKRGEQQKIFRQFQNGELDILIGTQLVAQGFNFPQVTLIGVVDADMPLFIPDFRAAEHAFQMLMQVAGRAGRELVTGDVVVQTRQPDHYALAYAARMDYSSFANQELKFREDLFYPPFSHLVRIGTAANRASKAETDIGKLVAWVDALRLPESSVVLGPTRSGRKLKGQAQFHVLLKVPTSVFGAFLNELKTFYRDGFNRYVVDVDPLSTR
jgi:primosomal protein N' (replication factor Y)